MSCACGAQGKYRCPACKSRYCSVACANTHKSTCEPRPTQKRFPLRVAHPPRNFLLEDEEAETLKDEQLDQMRHSQRLRELLGNEELRELVRSVDSSPNPLGALRSILAQGKSGDTLFQSAIDEMLKALGLMTPEGQSLF